jgi:hypothetical protein
MVVTSVLWTRTPVDPARLRSVVSDRLLAWYPVYLRKAVRHGGEFSWETDRGFDLGDHLVVRDREIHRPFNLWSSIWGTRPIPSRQDRRPP